MLKNNFFIITGAMGSGKSTVLKALALKGTQVVDEPARQIIAEQRAIDGEGLYDKNPELFAHLMLSRSIGAFQSHLNQDHPVIFDRGIPDNITYFQWFKCDDTSAQKASNVFRYNPQVFVLPAWKEIYTQDEDRTISFEQAQAFAEQSFTIYEQLGYTLHEVPKGSPQERADWILKRIKDWHPKS